MNLHNPAGVYFNDEAMNQRHSKRLYRDDWHEEHYNGCN